MTIGTKSNEFRVEGGETIKIGRVKFIVKEIETSKDDNQTDFDSFEYAQA